MTLIDRRAARAFRASVGLHGTPPWCCDRGLHEPAFVGAEWMCARCRIALNATDRLPPTEPIARLSDLSVPSASGVIFSGRRVSL